jgi:hypothetical protein
MSATEVRAYIIKPGDTEATETTVPVHDWLRPMQERIGGYVQPVPNEDGRVTFWCDEDGKPRGLPVNGLATAYWWGVTPAAINVDTLNGPVVITGAVTGKQGILPLPDEMVKFITESYIEEE